LFKGKGKQSNQLDRNVSIDTSADDNLDRMASVLKVYRASVPKKWDLIHTKLDLSFDYNKQFAYGQATIQLKPHFSPQDTLILDAKGLNFHEIYIIRKGEKISLGFKYPDSTKVYIGLGKLYHSNEKLEVYINYTAQPNLWKSKGSAAIHDDKGLYFINPTNETPDKPRQIWSQGETESNSCWFPTIDAPNQKMTQELNLTVDDSDMTISNGKLLYSTYEQAGKRTDHWKQMKPHAPYLTMIAIGRWAEVKDFWRDSIPVNYYIDAAYKQYAQLIFGKTTQMLECFSQKLQYAYPWDKFDQVVVRDYVSGAMENTSAVIHGENIQHNSREHLDDPHEDVISHEMFHHWFGDLVTCESWSNLPLNESFATYGEYIWREYAYGRVNADYHLNDDLEAYMREAVSKKEPLIRFHYLDKEDMFDNHSYQKGACTLHMLRKMVGDEAFFKSLNLYLKNRQFKTAEVHDLRLAFEEVTGEDLNWFFDDFFLKPGHPNISINYESDTINKLYRVIITQNSEHIYTFPLTIQIYKNGKVADGKKVWISHGLEEITFNTTTTPDWVNIDPDKSLLCAKDDDKTPSQWYNQFVQGSLYMDKHEAMEALKLNWEKAGEEKNYAIKCMQAALNDSFEGIRREALDQIYLIESGATRYIYIERTKELAIKDADASVRARALSILDKSLAPGIETIMKQAINDSSYRVIDVALNGLLRFDTNYAINKAEEFFKSSDPRLQQIGSGLVAQYGNNKYASTYKQLIAAISPLKRFGIYNDIKTLLGRTSSIEDAKQLSQLMVGEFKLAALPWFLRFAVRNYLREARLKQPNLEIKAVMNESLQEMKDENQK
jgi:aminopeptidase N